MITGRIEIVCTVCDHRTVIVYNMPSSLVCQSCGSNIAILTGSGVFTAICCGKDCGKTVEFKANIPSNITHQCGSVAYKFLGEGTPPPKSKQTNHEITSIVIPTWDSPDLIKPCVNSIREHTDIPYQLVVVDNGSSIEVIRWLKSILTGDDVIVSNPKNVGFTRGCNQGILLSTGYYILLLNDDTIVTGNNWLPSLIKGLEGASLVGPSCGRVVPNSINGAFSFIGHGHPSQEWTYLEGWCVLGKRSLFKDLGGFDEQFGPAYSEDADLSFRIKSKGGKIKVVKTQLRHLGQKTNKKLEKDAPGQSFISNRLLYRKWIDKSQINILVKRSGAIGDVAFTTPIVRMLAEKHKNSRIFYLTNCPQLIKNNPHIYKILKTANDRQFDEVYDLSYEDRPQENCIDAMADQAGVKLKSRKMDIPVEQKDKAMDYVVFHTGKVWPSRQWPVDRFNKVADYIASKGIGIVEIGDSKTIPMDRRGYSDDYWMQFFNKDWDYTLYLLKHSLFFFGLDSGPSVAAKGIQIPAIIVYGPVIPETRFADSIEYPLYIDDLECSGCRNRTTATYVKCKRDKVYCLENLTVDMAISRVDQLLKDIGYGS